MRILLIALTTTLLFSCSAQKHLEIALRKDPSIIKDSVTVDTIYMAPMILEDSVVLPKLKPCEINETINFDDGIIHGSIVIVGDIVKYTINTRPVKKPVRITHRTVTIRKKKPKPDRIEQFIALAWVIAIILIIGLISNIFRRK
jgi:hypothetical protein